MYIRGISEERAEHRPLPYTSDVVQAEILQLLRTLMSKIDDILAEVAAVRSAEDSAVTLINGIATLLRDALAANAGAGGGISATDADQIILQLEAGRAALADAVVANTPAAPPAPPANTTVPSTAPAATTPAPADTAAPTPDPSTTPAA